VELASGVAGSTAASGWRNAAAEPALAASGVPVLRIYKLSEGLWDAHIGNKAGRRLDCTHWCHPGASELWAWPLAQALAALPRLRHAGGGGAAAAEGVPGAAP
jgi:hypothetical protein